MILMNLLPESKGAKDWSWQKNSYDYIIDS
jgi:hypothetical protein